MFSLPRYNVFPVNSVLLLSTSTLQKSLDKLVLEKTSVSFVKSFSRLVVSCTPKQYVRNVQYFQLAELSTRQSDTQNKRQQGRSSTVKNKAACDGAENPLSDPSLLLWEQVQGLFQPAPATQHSSLGQDASLGGGATRGTLTAARRQPPAPLADEVEALYVLYVRGRLNWLKGRYVGANSCLERGAQTTFALRELQPCHLAMLVQVCNVSYGLNVSLFRVLVDQVWARLRVFSSTELTQILKSLAEIHGNYRQFQQSQQSQQPQQQQGASQQQQQQQQYQRQQQNDFVLPVFLAALPYVAQRRLYVLSQQRFISASQIATICVAYAEMHRQIRRTGMSGTGGASPAALLALRQTADSLFVLIEKSLGQISINMLTQLVLAYQGGPTASGGGGGGSGGAALSPLRATENAMQQLLSEVAAADGSGGGFGGSCSFFEPGGVFLDRCFEAALRRADEFDLQGWSRVEAVAERSQHPLFPALRERGQRFRPKHEH